jgi:osmotically-inducible protein OsmY
MRNRFTTLVAAATITLALAGPAWAVDDDPWITMKTKIALLTANNLRVSDVSVDTVSGVVTLHGKVSNEQEKERAENIARSVKGVKQVKNLLQIISKSDRDIVDANDEAIEANINAAFKANRRVNDSGIEVKSVNNGVVLLGGKTDSLPAYLEAVEVANAVKGVRRVTSEVEVPDDRN